MRLAVRAGAVGEGELGNGLGQRALGHHVDGAGHAGARRHARQQHVGAAQHFHALEHFDGHRVGRRNAVQAVGGDVLRAHVQPAQVEVLQQVVLVGGEDHGGVVLQHVLQGQGRPVLGQLARVGVHVHWRIHDRGGAQNAQPRTLGGLAPRRKQGQIFTLVRVADIDLLQRRRGRVCIGGAGCRGGRLGECGGAVGQQREGNRAEPQAAGRRSQWSTPRSMGRGKRLRPGRRRRLGGDRLNLNDTDYRFQYGKDSGAGRGMAPTLRRQRNTVRPERRALADAQWPQPSVRARRMAAMPVVVDKRARPRGFFRRVLAARRVQCRVSPRWAPRSADGRAPGPRTTPGRSGWPSLRG